MLKKLFITFTFFILIAGCSGGDKSPVDSGVENGIFHFGNGSEPQGIDPHICLLYTSPSPRDNRVSRMPSSA